MPVLSAAPGPGSRDPQDHGDQQDHPHGALHGVRVIVTRAPDRGASLLELLRRRGAAPVLVPVQEAEPVHGHEQEDLLELLEAASAGPQGQGPLWLVVTSANTVRALSRLARDARGRTLADVLRIGLEHGLRVAAVGPATAAELVEHGVPSHLQPHRTSSAAGLLDTWVRPEHGGPGEGPGTVLLPQSAAASPRLARGLLELGWQVRQRVAYRMAAWPAQAPLAAGPTGAQDTVWTASQARRELAAGRIEAAVFTAPSTVRALGRDAAQAPHPLGLAVIGEPTHAAVVELGLDAVVAASTEPEALVEALERAVRAAQARGAASAEAAQSPDTAQAPEPADADHHLAQEDRDDRSH